MNNEQELWTNFRVGNEESFKRLFTTYRSTLYNYGHKFTPNEQIIEDAIQEMFVKLWFNRETIRETPSVKNYLYKAFRRILIRKLESTIPFVDIAEVNYTFEIELPHDLTMIQAENAQQIHHNLSQAIAKISPRQREIIHLRYYGGLNYDQIAEIMGISSSSTYKLLYKSLDSLKGYLTTNEFKTLLALFLYWKNQQLGCGQPG